MAPTLAAVGCEMLRFETGEAVERSPRNRMLVRQSTVVNFLGERHLLRGALMQEVICRLLQG